MSDDESQEEMKERLEKVLKEAAGALYMKFDSVHITCTLYDGQTDETFTFSDGKGNYAARRGSIVSWLQGDEENTRDYVRQCRKEEREEE